ncbi:hypothetical protein C0995_011724 [Termitomyces sp. Mi166|nr:hypothetical protein C0995_011724 [Termitomyces sp. Mi166\
MQQKPGQTQLELGLAQLELEPAHFSDEMTVHLGFEGIPQASAAKARFMEIALAIKAELMAQIEAAMHFKMFKNNQQKILWVQLYLSGSAQNWSCVITTGVDNPEMNPRHFSWRAWPNNFKAGFCMQDPEQDMLTYIRELDQGLKSITDYCIAYFELKGKLGLADTNSKYVKNSF